jgi:hypothetical protein
MAARTEAADATDSTLARRSGAAAPAGLARWRCRRGSGSGRCTGRWWWWWWWEWEVEWSGDGKRCLRDGERWVVIMVGGEEEEEDLEEGEAAVDNLAFLGRGV